MCVIFSVNITGVIFLQKSKYINLQYYIAHSEGHNGRRAGPVDKEDGTFPLGPRNVPMQVCLAVVAFPWPVTYLHYQETVAGILLCIND